MVKWADRGFDIDVSQLYFGLGILLLIADQGTKAWIRSAFAPGESQPLIDGLLHITFVRNTGAAFGLMQGRTLLIIGVTLAVGFFLFMHRAEFARAKVGVRIAYTLGISGALGNFVDRVWLGWVTDFIDFRVWPVFNLADSAIVLGVTLLIWQSVFQRSEEPEQAREGD